MAANVLDRHYQRESGLSFKFEDKLIAKLARYFIHKIRCTAGDNTVFNNVFTIGELQNAFSEMDFNKSPGLDGIHGQILPNLRKLGKDFF